MYAVGGIARSSTGRTACERLPQPATGSHPSRTLRSVDEKRGQGEVRDRGAGHQARGRRACPTSEFRRRATNVPRATPRGTAISSAPPARSGAHQEPGRDHVDHRRAREPEREAEVAADDAGDVRAELAPERPVESVLGAEPRLERGVARVVAEERHDRVAGDELVGDERQDDGRQQDRQEPERAAKRVRPHRRALTPAASGRRAPQLSVTVLNGRNRKGVSCTPWTFGFRSAICIRTTSGHVPQSVSSTCSAAW